MCLCDWVCVYDREIVHTLLISAVIVVGHGGGEPLLFQDLSERLSAFGESQGAFSTLGFQHQQLTRLLSK